MSGNLELIDGASNDDRIGGAMRWTPKPEQDDTSVLPKFGLTAAEALEGIRRAGEVLRRLGPSAPLPPGQCRIVCGETIMYEGPVGEWP